MEAGDGIEVKDGAFVVKKENASLTFKFKGLENSETYLCFKNLGFKGKGKFFLFKYSYYKTPLTISSRADKNRRFKFCQTRDDFYVDIHDFVFNLGYSEEAEKEIKLTFDRKGEYSFDKISIVCQPFDAFPGHIENLRRDAWTDVRFDTNRVSGTVDFSADKLLLISIPYGKGWSAYVDGRKTPILRGNIMNLALPVEKGKHSIELVYETPLLKAGFGISVVTILLFAAFMLIRRRRCQAIVK